MKRFELMLARYAYKRDSLSSVSFETYEYAVQVTLEMLMGVLANIAIALCLNMKLEAVVFFFVFCVLRSYAGGLHLDKFSHCFLFSFAVTTGSMLLVKYMNVSLAVSGIMMGGGLIAFWLTKPVNDKNRDVNEEEDAYFKSKLRQSLSIITIAYFTTALLSFLRYSFLIALTVDVVYILMILGKWKNKSTV